MYLHNGPAVFFSSLHEFVFCLFLSKAQFELCRWKKKKTNIPNCPQDKVIKMCPMLLFCVVRRFAQGPPKSSFSSEQTVLLKFCSNTPGPLMNPVTAECPCRIAAHLKSVSFVCEPSTSVDVTFKMKTTWSPAACAKNVRTESKLVKMRQWDGTNK